MPRFTSTEASLYNGMSEQSAELRLPSQVSDAENAKLTVAKGIERRPPFELSHNYPDTFYSTDSLVHPINYDKDTAYLMVIGGDDSVTQDIAYGVDVIGQPNEHPLIIANGTDEYIYRENADGNFIPIEALQFTTVLDSTFVCNKNVVPEMDTAITPVLENFAYIWVTNGVQEVDRTVTVDGVVHTHAKIPDNDSKLIIDYFKTEINLQVGFSAVRISDSILKVVPDVDAEFSITSEDSYSDTTIEISKTWGTKIETLPPKATDGERMTIKPESNTEAEYYLQFDEDTEVWSEVSAPGKSFTFDPTTMPHRFIRKLDDGLGTITGIPFFPYFELEEIDWAPRTSGGGEDPELLPSFIGNKISDTFFFKNRLGFISGESVILSAVDDLFNFWPTTVQEVLDDDPIDITVSSTRNIELSHAATFPDSLSLIGDREQFSLSSGNKAFTAENVTLDPTTTYSASEIVPPVTTGSTMYFVAPQSAHASIREYAVQPDTLVTDAADVTGHVPTLLPNNMKQIIAEPNLEYLFLVDTLPYVEDEDNLGNLLHVYKYFWQGNEKVQSSWQKWRLWFNPLGGMIFNGSLWMLGQEKFDTGGDGLVLTRANLSDEPIPEFDGNNEPYKLPRPNVDREFPVVVIGDPMILNCTITIEVDLDTYNYFNVDDVSVVLVDRITGLVYRFITRFTELGRYYLTFDLPYCPTDLEDLECLVLGGYTTGGCEPFA